MKPLLLLSLALLSCATPPPAEPAPAPATTKATKKAPLKPKPYPLKTCLVTGDGLDEMDERVSTIHNGQTFEFCCKPCLAKFRKNPGRYVQALAKAER